MRWAVTTIVAVFLVVPGSALAQGSSSSFSQLAGERGCVTQEPPLPFGGEAFEGCGDARGLLSPYAVAVSPDDKHVYVASSGAEAAGSNAIVAFSRAGDTGALTSAGCVSDSGGDGRPGTDGFCADGDALLGASAVAVSPDGRHVYVASHISNGLAWLARDADAGTLTPVGLHQGVPARGSLPRRPRPRGHVGRRGQPGRQAGLRHRRQARVGQRVLARRRHRGPPAGHVRERERVGRAVHRRHRADRRQQRHGRARRGPGLRHGGGDRRGHRLRA